MYLLFKPQHLLLHNKFLTLPNTNPVKKPSYIGNKVQICVAFLGTVKIFIDCLIGNVDVAWRTEGCVNRIRLLYIICVLLVGLDVLFSA